MSTVVSLRGFRNLGNTCYMNSTLQALLSSNILNTALLLYIRKRPEALKDFSPMLIEYYRVILDLLGKNVSPVYEPRQFKMTLDKENERFRGFAQQDANELTQYIVNEFADEKKDEGVARIVRRLCFGKYKSYICCDECKHIEEGYSNFLDVTLPIPSTRNPDLEDCFKRFAQYEVLEGSNKWRCPKCNKLVVAYKKMEINDVPEVAVFTLNRFRGTMKNNTPVKIYHLIELEGKKLKLIATVNHYGATGGGHYGAYVTRKDKWYRADDSTIHESNGDTVLNDPSVYMVIYQVVC
jgi:ubiquitin carboxyl-terminal hydrolase 36/42